MVIKAESMKGMQDHSPGEPVNTCPHMWWQDNATGVLKLRNASNTRWIEVAGLSKKITG